MFCFGETVGVVVNDLYDVMLLGFVSRPAHDSTEVKHLFSPKRFLLARRMKQNEACFKFL